MRRWPRYSRLSRSTANNQGGDNTPFHFSKWFETQVQATARKMEAEKLDVCVIPDGQGMVLLRIDSAEFRRRSGALAGVIKLPIRSVGGGCTFIVATS